MFPTVDNSHVSEGLALLTDHYRNKTVIPGLLKSFLASCQELETVLWSIIDGFLLTTPPVGAQLDAIGSIVGAPRGILSDADYLTTIKIQIRVNRSQGLAEDMLQILVLCNPSDLQPTYLDQPVGCFLVESWNLPSPNLVAALLSHARSIGTRGVLHYSTWPDGNDFMFGSRYSASAGQGKWGSRYTSTVGGLMVAGAPV